MYKAALSMDFKFCLFVVVVEVTIPIQSIITVVHMNVRLYPIGLLMIDLIFCILMYHGSRAIKKHIVNHHVCNS